MAKEKMVTVVVRRGRTVWYGLPDGRRRTYGPGEELTVAESEALKLLEGDDRLHRPAPVKLKGEASQ